MKKLIQVIVFIMVVSGFVSAREITGKVTDVFGNPISGVSVLVKGKQNGTLTDMQGVYKIEVQDEDKILVFSFIGMETKEVNINAKSVINVSMEVKPQEQEEIVIAKGISRSKMNRTGAMAIPAYTGSQMAFFKCESEDIMNTENYAMVNENGFRNAQANPLSTFSIDVDNASYSNMRRFINNGEKPPVDAVRIEEMINYFSYDYPAPKGEHPFSVTTELGECPWNQNHYLLHVGLKGKSIEKSELPPSNLVFLIDVSGSMTYANKLPLLKRAFRLLVNELREQDKVSIVVYAGAAGKVLDATSGDQKRKILNALDNLQAGGSTAGGEGLKLAYKTARENYINGGNNRIILATDGDFNVGVSSTSEMQRLVEKERESGIFMSVAGFGTGNIKDDKMETIADKGNGNYAYIDNILEARKVFINEFGGTLFTIAKDVKFQLEFNPQQVKSYRLIGYENRLLNDEDFNDDKKDAGEMGAGHTVTALYEIIPAGVNSDETPSVDPLKYQKTKPVGGKYSNELLTVKLRYKAPDGNKSKLLEMPLQKRLEKNTSDDFRFSAAVAAFGMLIRNSEFKGNATFDLVLDMAGKARGDDEEGYRSEFIQIVKVAKDLGLAEK